MLYVVMEASSYIPMAFLHEENYTKPFYVLHLLGISCDITAFSLVTVLWSRTILVDDRRRMSTVFPFVIVVDVAFFAYSVYVCINLLADYGNESLNEWAEDSPSYRNLLIAEPVSSSEAVKRVERAMARSGATSERISRSGATSYPMARSGATSYAMARFGASRSNGARMARSGPVIKRPTLSAAGSELLFPADLERTARSGQHVL